MQLLGRRQQAARAPGDASLDLSVMDVAQIIARQRSKFRILAEWITHFHRAHAVHEKTLKFIAHLVGDDEVLGDDAAQAGFRQPSPNARITESSISASSSTR